MSDFFQETLGDSAGIIIGSLAFILTALFWYFVLPCPINIHSTKLIFLFFYAGVAYVVVGQALSVLLVGVYSVNTGKIIAGLGIAFLAALALIFTSSPVFHAEEYEKIRTADSKKESVALMDASLVKKIGDEKINSISGIGSQYNVSDDFSQLEINGTPKEVAPLEYAGFREWLNSKDAGVPGYVTVDPASMSASYSKCKKGMKYVPSAYFLQDADRHIHLSYPTLMLESAHFEVDEEGNPYYVAPYYKTTIGLFGGQVVDGVVILDPCTGATKKYALEDIPKWFKIK